MKKRFFALLLCLALCASLIPAALAAEITLVPPPADEPARIVASGDCGEQLHWELNDKGTLTIFGGGSMDDFRNQAPWYSYRSNIKAVVVGDQATSIGDGAFFGCLALESVTIGSRVYSIGQSAFSQCGSLQSVTLGKGVREIGSGAFAHCSSLQEVVFRGEAPTFGSYVFYNDALVAYYPAGDASWTDSKRQGYRGFILWVPDDGPRITLTAYDSDAAAYRATFTGGGTLSDGVCAFTLANENDRAALVAIKDGDAYTRLPCTTDENKAHHFTLTVNGDTEMFLVLKGDVNLDGVLKGTDGTMLKRAMLGSYSYPEDLKGLCELVADLNGDGTIKGSEGTQVARAVLGTHTIPW